MDAELNQHVQELQQWRAGADEKFHTLFRIAGEQTAALKEATEATNALRVELKVFVATLSSYKPCPAPGACIALDQRITALELAQAEAKGGWKVIATIGSLGGVLGSVVTWLVEHFAKHVPLFLLLLALVGCASPAPLKGGKATTLSKPTQCIEQTVAQGENPAQVSKQDQETVRVKTYTVPAGSRIEESRALANGQGAVVTNVQAVVVSAPMPVVEREETRAKTELGAAQKDTARELGAKLASLKGIEWVGVALFLFGLASIFYPPLKLLIGSVTTSAAICAGGILLLVLPTLVVGNELLILGGVGVAVGGWFLAHRHGRLQGLVDANKNGVDDRLETKVGL